MKQFTIHFYFEGREYEADVTEIGGLDDVQYSISPEDEDLAERYRTNIIRKPKSEAGFQYTLPDAAGGDAFMKSLEEGLSRAIAQ